MLDTQWQVEMRHFIGPVELYGVVLSRHLWHTQLAALEACVRGPSGSLTSRQLFCPLKKDELQGQTLYWSHEYRLLPMLRTNHQFDGLV